MDKQIEVERFQGVLEPSPEPGDTVYHATVYVADAKGKEWPNGFTFHGPINATPETLQDMAQKKWAEIRQSKVPGN